MKAGKTFARRLHRFTQIKPRIEKLAWLIRIGRKQNLVFLICVNLCNLRANSF